MDKQFLIKVGICLFLANFTSCKNNKHLKGKDLYNKSDKIEVIKIFKDGNSKIDEYSELNMELADTIFLGGNVGNITNYKPRRNDIEYLLSVIIENEYNNGIIVNDTFSDGTLAPWFGVHANKTGYKIIKGIIVEEGLNDTKTEIDSVFRIERTSVHFSKKVYVIDSIFKKNKEEPTTKR
jgi:hypothetical protein